jgi:hypothetical protein
MASSFTPAKLQSSSKFSTDVGETTRHIIVDARWSVAHEVKRFVNVSSATHGIVRANIFART